MKTIESIRNAIQFQPTLPARGATKKSSAVGRCKGISTHAPRTGSDMHPAQRPVIQRISTHAPRTGSDQIVRILLALNDISTHAPRTGSDGARASARLTC